MLRSLFPSMLMPLTLMAVLSLAVADQGHLYRKANTTAPAGVAKSVLDGFCGGQICNDGFSHCSDGICVCNSNCYQDGPLCVCHHFQAWYVIVPIVIIVLLAVLGIVIRCWLLRRMLARRQTRTIVVSGQTFGPQSGPPAYPQAGLYPQANNAYAQPPPPNYHSAVN